MGWYHVVNSGKGFVLGFDEKIYINETGLTKYVLPKVAAEKAVGERLPHYDDLPPFGKTVIVTKEPGYLKYLGIKNEVPTETTTEPGWGRRIGSKKYDPAEFTAEDFKKVDMLYARKAFFSALSVLFEHYFGYPVDSFRSVSDYDSTVMIYCNAVWPPEAYNKALANMTEAILTEQLRQFVSDVTGDKKYRQYDLALCEEYDKE